jgi:hypothetical protein
MQPTEMTKGELLRLLDEMRDRIADDDSCGGSMEYEAEAAGLYSVRAAYRYGNREHGQGFMRMAGRVET